MSALTDPPAVNRRAARVLLLDGAHRLLLFRRFDPGDPGRPPFWFTVGGGLDSGESVPAGTASELREETGPASVASQREYFHVARVTGATIDTSGFNDIERRSVLGHRWWTADELVTTSEVIYPAELAELLPAVLAGEVPEPPLELSR